MTMCGRPTNERWFGGSMDRRTYRWSGGPTDELASGQSGGTELASGRAAGGRAGRRAGAMHARWAGGKAGQTGGTGVLGGSAGRREDEQVDW